MRKKSCVEGKLGGCVLAVVSALAYGGVAVVVLTLAGCASLDRARSAIECSVQKTYQCLTEEEQRETL